MNREKLLRLHEMVCADAKKIMVGKNNDYAGGTADPFANFRASVLLGVKPEIGILLRCMDKFKRIETFIHAGTLLVKNESVDDAIQDVINYLILLKGMIEEKKEESELKRLNMSPGSELSVHEFQNKALRPSA